MENEKEKEQIIKIDEFYKLLSSMKAVSPIYEKIMKHLVKSLAPEISDDAQKVLYIYFSLLEDGNTRIPLDSVKLLEKWDKKWSGLVVQAKSQDKYNELQSIEFENNNYFNKQIFEKGIEDLLKFINNEEENVLPRQRKALLCSPFSQQADSSPTIRGGASGERSSLMETLGNNSLFVIDENDGAKYLYANKYFEAKLIIEDKFKKLFNKNRDGGASGVWNDSIINDLSRITNSEIELNKEQLEAVSKGIADNIIVTGGPGTGKTTVVTFILWFLIKNNNDYLKNNIYLTAPSGKAADRVGESLKNTLSLLHPNSDEQIIKEKLLNLESYTIHRLLKYNPGSGKFTYNKDNQFADESIFVIDEASMIDISMFACLLEAIPENAKVFILGDVDQLPSVDAGAVLGDLLNSSNNVVRLIESKRFKVGSEIAELKDYIQDRKLGKNTNYEFRFETYAGGAFSEINHVKFISLIEDDRLPSQRNASLCSPLSQQADSSPNRQKAFGGASSCGKEDYRIIKNNLEGLLKKWIDKFYFVKKENICSLAEKVNPLDDNPDVKQIELRNQLWNIALSSKILCAEKRSLTGLDRVNSFVYNYLKQLQNKASWVHNDGRNNSRYFCGQQLIITKNQEMYKLYNGDTGVVVVADNGAQYLMVRKNNEFAFYPLSIFPVDSIENAFAITIHKSQGSEYNHILMFLPNLVGHRVLTNQIIYTGITRAKESVTIVGSKESFDFACQNVIKRDTGISLDR